MKKIWNRVFIALAAIMTFSFVSCDYDKDDSISYNLDGIWEGDIAVESIVTIHGEERFTESMVRASFEFQQHDYTAHGIGYESYYVGTKCIELKFNYQIENEVIYLTYENGERQKIRNYSLDKNAMTFSGWIVNLQTNDSYQFTMVKVVK